MARVIFPITIPNQNNRQVGNIIEVNYPEEIFPKNWLNSAVSVVFDFKGLASIDVPSDIRHYIFCLLPIKNAYKRYVIQVSRLDFIENAKTGSWEFFINREMGTLEKS